MNPSNKSLQRTYFIGGPPRVGKSILAYRLAEKLKGHVISTDAIRNAAKKACSDKESDLFVVSRHESLPTQDWLKQHFERPHETVEVQNKESKAVWQSLVSFCNSFVEDSAVHIVEGVALLPSLIASMKHRPNHIIYVGNTSETHAQAMIDYGKSHPEQDWMVAMNYSHEKIEAMASFILEMSLYFKREAEKHGFSYYEISDEDFEGSLDKIINALVTK